LLCFLLLIVFGSDRRNVSQTSARGISRRLRCPCRVEKAHQRRVNPGIHTWMRSGSTWSMTLLPGSIAEPGYPVARLWISNCAPIRGRAVGWARQTG